MTATAAPPESALRVRHRLLLLRGKIAIEKLIARARREGTLGDFLDDFSLDDALDFALQGSKLGFEIANTGKGDSKTSELEAQIAALNAALAKPSAPAATPAKPTTAPAAAPTTPSAPAPPDAGWSTSTLALIGLGVLGGAAGLVALVTALTKPPPQPVVVAGRR